MGGISSAEMPDLYGYYYAGTHVWEIYDLTIEDCRLNFLIDDQRLSSANRKSVNRQFIRKSKFVHSKKNLSNCTPY
jgi:hypothetical protein